jgi:hypothetical protein
MRNEVFMPSQTIAYGDRVMCFEDDETQRVAQRVAHRVRIAFDTVPAATAPVVSRDEVYREPHDEVFFLCNLDTSPSGYIWQRFGSGRRGRTRTQRDIHRGGALSDVVFMTQLSLSITSQKLELATAVRDSSDTRVMNGVNHNHKYYVQFSTRIELFTLNIFS